MTKAAKEQFMREAIRLSLENADAGTGGPFGAVITKGGQILARGANRVTSSNDPTAHAEIVAIREACHVAGDFCLSGCEIFCSCEPCPMCLGAIYWARLDAIYFGNSKSDAAAIDFDDQFIYAEMEKPLPERSVITQQILSEEALQAFKKWAANSDKIEY